MTTLAEVIRDVAVDARCLELADDDFGLAHDLRLVTRRSLPTLWPGQYDAASHTAQTVPDCAAIVKRAARYRREQRIEDYERCMRALQAFFVCDDAAPARTPAEVRAAFGLTSNGTDERVQRNEQHVRRLAPFLDRKATWKACCAPVDMSQVDALANARASQ